MQSEQGFSSGKEKDVNSVEGESAVVGATITQEEKELFDKLLKQEEKRKDSLKRVAAKQTIILWKAKKQGIDASKTEIDDVVANNGRIPGDW